MNIKEALQKAKTCAPVSCNGENICFILGKEVERLQALLEPMVEEDELKPPAEEITIAEPTSEATESMWDAA